MAYISTVNVIPSMTSNTAPSGIASASSKASTTNDAWNAFNESNVNWESSTTVDWIAYEFSNELIIGKYGIHNSSTSSSPTSWTFEGWNGDTWIVLDTQTDVRWSVNGQIKHWEISNNSSFKKYRLNITKGNGYSAIQIKIFELYEVLFVNKVLISSSSSELKSVIKGGYISKIPAMTSNTAPYGTAKAETARPTYDAFKLFDKSVESEYMASISPSYVVKGWVEYEFPNMENICQYSLTCGDDPAQMASDWTFEAYNGSSWIPLDSQKNIQFSFREKKMFAISNTVEYKRYRVNILKNNGNIYGLRIGEIDMFSFNKTILKSISSSTEQNFINHGMDKSEELDLSKEMSNKLFIEQSPTTLGSGKVFRKPIDTSRVPIKKVSIE